MKASSQATPAVRKLERQRKDSAFKFNAEVALPYIERLPRELKAVQC